MDEPDWQLKCAHCPLPPHPKEQEQSKLLDHKAARFKLIDQIRNQGDYLLYHLYHKSDANALLLLKFEQSSRVYWPVDHD